MKRRIPYLLSALCLLGVAGLVPAIDTQPGPKATDGTYAVVDFPSGQHARNTGGIGPRGPGTGDGLCVFTAVQMGGNWHNIPQIAGLQKYMTTKEGGGYPEKVDQVLTQYCASQGKPVPAYVQHVGGEEEVLDLAMKTGRMIGITYAGNDGFYQGPILHMVNLAHLDANWGAIIDNNRPGKWIWMTRKQLLNRWRGVYDNGSMMTVVQDRQTFQVGGGWAFVFLGSPPPPYTKSPVIAYNARDSEPLPELVNFGLRPQPPKAEKAPEETNFGIDVEKIRAAQRRYALNGTEVSKVIALAAVLADDSDRFNLTFVGIDPPVSPSAIPATIRDRVHVQVYKGDEWEVSQFGLRKGVTLRKPAAKRVAAEVLHQETFDTNAIIAALVGGPNPVDPVKPVDPTNPVKPGPIGAVVITQDDLTAAGKAKLEVAGVATLTLSVTPKAAPAPMPGPVVPAPVLPVVPAQAKVIGPLVELKMVAGSDDGKPKTLGTDPVVVKLDTLLVTILTSEKGTKTEVKLPPGSVCSVNGKVLGMSDCLMTLMAQGTAGVNVTFTPAVAAKPASVEFDYFMDKGVPQPAEVKPTIKTNEAGVPVEAAPVGKRWVKFGDASSTAPWVLEDAPAYMQTPFQPANFQFQNLRRATGGCPGGVCPKR